MIDVALRPADARAAEVTVVVDVLRATTTITRALGVGYRRVLVVGSIDRALALRAPGRVIAGEQACVMPVGFDLGNSPGALEAGRGEELVLATTNGAPAIVAAARLGGVVVVGCLLNLDAVVRAIGSRDTVVVCAGVSGELGVDDVYVAGRIAAALDGPRTDAALAAQAVAAGFASASAALGAGAAARMLREAGLHEDVAYCAQESVLDLVPSVTGLSGDVATIEIDQCHSAQISLAALESAGVP